MAYLLLSAVNWSVPGLPFVKLYQLAVVVLAWRWRHELLAATWSLAIEKSWLRETWPAIALLTWCVARSTDLATAALSGFILALFLLARGYRTSGTVLVGALGTVLLGATLGFVLPDSCAQTYFQVQDRRVLANDPCAMRAVDGDGFRFNGLMSDANQLGLWGLGLALIAPASLKRRSYPLALLLLVMTKSRSAAAGALLYVFQGASFKRRTTRAAAIVAVTIAVAALLFVRSGGAVGESARLGIWREYAATIVESGPASILIGAGSAAQSGQVIEDLGFSRSPHNTPLQVLLQLGLVGLALLVLALARAGRSAIPLVPVLLTLDLLFVPLFWFVLASLGTSRDAARTSRH